MPRSTTPLSPESHQQDSGTLERGRSFRGDSAKLRVTGNNDLPAGTGEHSGSDAFAAEVQTEDAAASEGPVETAISEVAQRGCLPTAVLREIRARRRD